MKDQTPYALLHTVYNLCQIMLHREYVPFIPLRSKKPEGPLDPPLFPPDKYDVPTGFWEDSARQCFKAARDIMDLVRTCDDCRVLVETPIVGFAIYTVAFVGVYCINFPWMDPDGYMCTSPTPHHGKPATNANGASKGFEAARKSLEMIGGMRPKLHMADGWFKTINRMHKYFRSIRRDYERNVQANESMASDCEGSSISSRQLSLREGGIGGGLEEFRLFERTLLEFGNLEDHDVEMADARPNNKALDALYDDDNSGDTVKSEEGGEQNAPEEEQATKSEGPWNAINTAPGAARQTPTATPTTNGTFRSYESYQQPTAAYAPNQPPPQYQPPHVNNFRPAYMPPEGPAAPNGVPPGLTSPNSRTASSGSHPSPSYDGRHQSYGGWTPHNPGYGMHPAPQPHHAYTNGNTPQHGLQPSTPVNMMHAYPTPGAPMNHGMPPQQPMQEPPPQIYDPMAKEAWLNSVSQTGLSGDDVAVFVDGGEIPEWAARNPNGWLGQIYNHQH